MDWPWMRTKALRRELRAARLACSASDKKCDRLTRRIRILEAACVKHHAQERRDQLYIDALEARLETAIIAKAREETIRAAIR